MQVRHALKHREPRKKCLILKGRFPSRFASKGSGLQAGLQSSSKAVLHEYFRDCISSSSWVLSVSSCIPTQNSTWHEVVEKSTYLQRHQRGLHTNLQVFEIRIPWNSADRRQPLPRPGIRTNNFSPVLGTLPSPRRLNDKQIL